MTPHHLLLQSIVKPPELVGSLVIDPFRIGVVHKRIQDGYHLGVLLAILRRVHLVPCTQQFLCLCDLIGYQSGVRKCGP
jgi:hypothetical protein